MGEREREMGKVGEIRKRQGDGEWKEGRIKRKDWRKRKGHMPQR